MSGHRRLTTCLLVLVLGLVCFCHCVGAGQIPCYTSDPNPYRRYSTKSAYAEIPAVTGGTDTGRSDTVDADCYPVMIWHLLRHGYRYPADSDIELFNALLPVFRDNIVANTTVSNQFCAGDLAALRDWKPRMDPSDGSKLVMTGYEEMMRIAKNFRIKYPTLLNVSIDDMLASFHFRHTDTERTRESAKSFAKGLLKQPGMTDQELEALVNRIPMTVYPTTNDRLLRFFDACERYKKTIRSKPVAELDKFDNGSIMSEVIANISRRIGLRQNMNISVSQSLWLACASEYAIYGLTQDSTVKNSSAAPWCSVFSQDDLKAFEYRTDLAYYYKNSYGHKLSYEQACPLLKDFIGSIRNATTKDNFTKVVIRVGHSPTIVPFYANLGLFKDSRPLTADNFLSQGNRKLRTSYIDPMASNINFVIYKCGNAHKFKMHVNERETTFPGCNGVFCDIETLMGSVGKAADTCDFDQMCKWPIHPSTGGATRADGAMTFWLMIFSKFLMPVV
ncbi:multiple inositol polyphosphate phosphatase 1 isoform X1 [Lingula anatina]|uniref:Multiple inositol polyphosphate phosphatase 1 n=1 Tax=Lingula anatina TaxID=7574 RepID=A0A1S3HBY2_LINAN|nr:multiple inositol polyphosphate phosphatase 1 isoform X1 [Lingula anatina]|eukprot:XP_013383537.1 multiple inositol polyphosphate phosphatase 1 isoform X1 [Lingula anatina]